jgi:pilus assembly protein CpaC
MSWSRITLWLAGSLPAAILLAWAGAAAADGNEKLLIPVGHAQVVISDEPVKTVAIAEPRVADAAVGSERTVVVNGKAAGGTSLVVYGEGGRFRVYDVEVFVPNADKQVALRVHVAEVNGSAKKELGFDFVGWGRVNHPNHNDVLTGGLFTSKVASPSIPLTVGPRTDGAIDFSRDGGNFNLQTTWRALEEKGDIRVLANPTLVARSGEKASFHAGGEFPIPIASSAAAAGPDGAATIAITIDWKDFGVKVDFKPEVDADGSISLQVEPEVSQLDFTNPLILNGFTLPIVVTRKTATTVRMNAGEHLVIGGLKQTEHVRNRKKVPVLGDIPLVGFFFSTTRTENVERELLVVVSPEILDGAQTTMPALPTDRTPQK